MSGINRTILIVFISSILLFTSIIMPIRIKASLDRESSCVTPESNNLTKQSLPLYISKFWQDISIDDIPNNKRLYNCTATVQMLYAKWISKLAEELGYLSVNEMLEYSSKVMAIKKTIEETKDSVDFVLSSYTGIKYPKEIACWLRISEILNKKYYCKLSKEDAIDSLMLSVGLIDPSWKSATWKVVQLMTNNGYAVFQKMDKNGRLAIDIWKESGGYLPLDPAAMEVILPGDIATGRYHATHYRDKYTTHLTVYIGKRDDLPCFAEQFGKDVKITPLDKMYAALRTGFEAVIRPIIIIAPDKTEKFLATPLSSYKFDSQAMPMVLIFKQKAVAYLTPIQTKINSTTSNIPIVKKIG